MSCSMYRLRCNPRGCLIVLISVGFLHISALHAKEYDSILRQCTEGQSVEACNTILSDPRGNVDDTLAAQEGLAEFYFSHRSLDKAIAQFDRLLRAAPRFMPRALFHRGVAQAASGQWNRAIRDFTTIISTVDRDGLKSHKTSGVDTGGDQIVVVYSYYADALRERCHAESNISRWRAAVDDCSLALKWRPGDANAFDYRGFANLQLMQLEAAIADYRAALELSVRLAASLYGRGLAERAMRNEAAATVDLNAAKAIEPQIDDANFPFALDGRCWADMRLLPAGDEARWECDESLRQRPQDASALADQGFRYLIEGNDAALETYTAALRADDKMAVALYGRGLAEHISGQVAASQRDVAAALALDPAVAKPFDYYYRGMGLASPLEYTKNPLGH
jgi:tetratricopeptide (TPR) repeat protein